MKKIYLLAVIIFLCISSYAQLDKGSILLGGSLGVGHTSQKIAGYTFNSTNYALSPSVGIFYKANRLVGFGPDFGRTKTDTTTETNYYGARVFLRQYFPLGKSFYFLIEEGVRVYNARYYQNGGSNKYTYASLYLNPGFAFSASPRFQIEVNLAPLAALSYQHLKTTYNPNVPNGTNSTTNTFSLSAATDNNYFYSLSFGVRWLLY